MSQHINIIGADVIIFYSILFSPLISYVVQIVCQYKVCGRGLTHTLIIHKTAMRKPWCTANHYFGTVLCVPSLSLSRSFECNFKPLIDVTNKVKFQTYYGRMKTI